MELSNMIYYCFIPIGILAFTIIIIELVERLGHKYFSKKILFYICAGVTCSLIVIVLVILSLFI